MFVIYVIGVVIFVCFGVVVFRGSPYVPSHKKDVRQALGDLYHISDKDVLVDIGSGDGLVLREAQKLGVKKAVGYEINPILVLISKFLSRNSKNINIRLVDFWLTNLPDDVTVVYMFSVSRDVKKFVKKIDGETKRLGRPVFVIGYGSEFIGKKAIKKLGPNYLYKF